MTTPRTVLAVDIGGTKLAAGIVDDTPTLLRRSVAPTRTATREDCLAGLFSQIDELLSGDQSVEAIGVGVASMVDFRAGRIVESTHLPLSDVPLREILADRYGVTVAIDNDATVACIGEHRWGAGVGVDEMIMLTLGTGVGGGIISRGQPHRGLSGAAAELGHMVIDINGPPCQGGCPSSGCLEVMASGTALGVAARAHAEAFPVSALGRALAGGEVVNGELLARLAEAGDTDALAIFERIGGYLGTGMTNLINIFNPELVVVGGGAAAVGELLLGPARRVVAATGLRPQRDEVRIVRARFGADAGLIGAAALAWGEAVPRL